MCPAPAQEGTGQNCSGQPPTCCEGQEWLAGVRSCTVSLSNSFDFGSGQRGALGHPGWVKHWPGVRENFKPTPDHRELARVVTGE